MHLFNLWVKTSCQKESVPDLGVAYILTIQQPSWWAAPASPRMVTSQDANTKPSEQAAQSLGARCGYHEMPQAVRSLAAPAEVQHSFREACMRYMGVARGQGWETAWTVEGSLGEMVGALVDLALDPEWGGDHSPV